MICSVSDVPERGIPSTKTGFAEAEPPSVIDEGLARVEPDHLVRELLCACRSYPPATLFKSSLPRR